MVRFLVHRFRFAAVVVVGFVSPAVFADEPSAWKTGAAKYLDGRAGEWFAFASANRGNGATRSSCVSCHTLFPYAIARAALHSAGNAVTASEFEQKLRAQTVKRVEGWEHLESADFGLF